MSTSSTIIVSFVTSLLVAGGVSYFFHYGLPFRATAEQSQAATQPELVEIPNLTGLKVSEAKARLSRLGLSMQVATEESDTIPAEQVFSTSPSRYAMVKQGAVVELKVSSGVQRIKVPNLRRMTLRQAKEAIKAAGLIHDVRFVDNEDLELGIVRQEPKANEAAAPGSKVVITFNTDDY